jgi:hypothetical protein
LYVKPGSCSNDAVSAQQTTATDSLRLPQIEGLRLQDCTAGQGEAKRGMKNRARMAEAITWWLRSYRWPSLHIMNNGDIMPGRTARSLQNHGGLVRSQIQ